MIFNLFPQGRRNICSGSGRTFLSLIFECSACEGSGYLFSISRCIGKNVIFSSGFTHDTRVGFIFLHISGYGFPHSIKDTRRARKM